MILSIYDDEALGFEEVSLNEGFTLDYIGYLPQESNPYSLWRAIEELCEEDKELKQDLKINITGDINSEVMKSIKTSNLMMNWVMDNTGIQIKGLCGSIHSPHSEKFWIMNLLLKMRH